MGLRERLVASAAEIRTRSQRLVELNVELLTAELRRKGQEYGSAVGLLVGAAVLALYALGFALTTIAVALALVLPLWLALLIVTAVLFLIVLILALVGRSRLRRVKPSPERAIAEAKTTADTLKTKLQQTASELAPRRNGGASSPGGILSPAAERPAPSPRATPTPPTTPPGAPTPTPREMPPSDDEVL
jgi:tetrahydromethanopterin S-methyltransferase subunit G/Sec-independent protein translocase protein TatA